MTHKMDVKVFVKLRNADTYDNLGSKEFAFLPRENEFISTEVKGEKKYFQVIAVHHGTQSKLTIEIYAVQTDPTWELKKKRSIGFGS